MNFLYPLKRSDQIDLVEPVAFYIERVESHDKGKQFRELFSKITPLRNKVTSFVLESNDLATLNKYIAAIELYVKIALLMGKHLNWNKDFGDIMGDLRITWYDSFAQEMKFMRNEIHYDIFCCMYNLGVLYFQKSMILSKEEFKKEQQQALVSAKTAAYLFNRIRNEYYPAYRNTNFSDTNFAHLEMLEYTCVGVFYKCMFIMFKEDQYKIGIDNVAIIAKLAQTNFYASYEIAKKFFMTSSYISAKLKEEMLSFTYVEALYHDLMFNTRYAKYYKEVEMESNRGNIVNLIAYERKALRLLDIGFADENVSHLLDLRPVQKKQMEVLRPRLEKSMNENRARNERIFKKEEITEEQIPPPKQTPPEYLLKYTEPESLKITYEGTVMAPFATLADNESKGFMNDLKVFANNRLQSLEAALTKLKKNIQVIYNDNFVNYYFNMESNVKSKGVPEVLKQKIDQIKANGGRAKLEMEVKILESNSNQATARFKELRKILQNEEEQDAKRRNEHGPAWILQKSSNINRPYFNDLEIYEGKNTQASNANKTIIGRYENLKKYIMVIDGNQQQVMEILPKMEISVFLQENRDLFQRVKSNTVKVKMELNEIEQIVVDLRNMFGHMDFKAIASIHFKNLKPENKEHIYNEIFRNGYKLIEEFNHKCKQAEFIAKEAGNIASELNSKNKGGDDRAKKQFEELMSRFNEVTNLFRDLSHGTIFYVKINDILMRLSETIEGYAGARAIEASDLQQALKRGGFGKGPALPSIYSKQPQQPQNFYVPPQMSFNDPLVTATNFNQKSMNDVLEELLVSKPIYKEGNIFSANSYNSVLGQK